MYHQRVLAVLAVLAATPAAVAGQTRSEPASLQQSAAAAPVLAADPRLGDVEVR